MPPSAEHNRSGVTTHSLPMRASSNNLPSYPTKNVTFAVNYEISMVDQFCPTQPRKRRSSVAVQAAEEAEGSTIGDTAATPPPPTATRRISNMENKAPNHHSQPAEAALSLSSNQPQQQQPSELGDNNSTTNSSSACLQQSRVGVTIASSPAAVPSSLQQRRVSAREKKQPSSTTAQKRNRNRVRYDMQLVPAVQRNKSFLQSFAPWWLRFRSTDSSGKGETSQPPAVQRRRSSRLTGTEQKEAPCSECGQSTEQHLKQADPLPLPMENTVVWVPGKRAEWEDTVSEMTAVCTSAALRRHQARWMSGDFAMTNKAFYPPLSRDYIRDRIDIDDPLRGYQLRHKTGGWLQGFCCWTTFTTWTHYFRFDSLHEKSGIPRAATSNVAAAASLSNAVEQDDFQFVDRDGSLAAELEAQPRSGDPLVGGIVFDGIAEIALLGGLGCGEYALRMALDDIRASDKQYKFVVLQATDSSKSFYERFGFRRVGAVCRYVAATSQGQEAPIQGYRHWTHSNESETSLQMHGGPSYMMCLKIRDAQSTAPSTATDGATAVAEESETKSNCSACGRSLNEEGSATKPATFLEHMMTLKVEDKPKVEPLGAASTPGPKAAARRSSAAAMSRPMAGEMLFPNNGSATEAANAAPMTLESLPPHSHKHRLQLNRSNSNVSQDQLPPPTKRRRMEGSFHPSPMGGNLLLKGKEPLSMKQKVSRKKGPLSGTPSAKAGAKSAADGSTPRRRSKAEATKRSSSKKKKQSATGASPGRRPSSADRLYHSVRGPDGRFVQVPIDGKQAVASPPARSAEKASKVAKNPPRPPLPTAAAVAAGKVSKVAGGSHENEETSKRFSAGPASNKRIPIDKANLVKQKVKSYPRKQLHYFNRVVKKKKRKPQDGYFFVVHYDDVADTVRIVPMEPRGLLTGKREGKPRYQACIQDTDANFVTAPAQDYVIVPSSMVMKTPVVANEAWDIEE